MKEALLLSNNQFSIYSFKYFSHYKIQGSNLNIRLVRQEIILYTLYVHMWLVCAFILWAQNIITAKHTLKVNNIKYHTNQRRVILTYCTQRFR